MEDHRSISRPWWRSQPARLLTVALLLQAFLFYNSSQGEAIPLRQPLSSFPMNIDSWKMVREDTIEEKVQEVLRASDTLSRSYVSTPDGGDVHLFVAYFESQRQGQTPHSPKHCMPGSGWTPERTETVSIRIDGRPEPIAVNYFVLEKGTDKTLALYWYQANQRVIASEYAAKIYLVWDAIRYNRTDTALVRVLSSVPGGENEAEILGRMERFVQSVFPQLGKFLPS